MRKGRERLTARRLRVAGKEMRWRVAGATALRGASADVSPARGIDPGDGKLGTFFCPHAVSRQGSDRLLDWNKPELHAERLRSLRKVATISARIETAISAGETAPISSPIGA